MAEYAVQAILHALVAALVVEALLCRWHLREPRVRLRYRLLVLAYPVLILPLLLWLAPVRATDAFRDRWALFAADRWTTLSAGALGVDRLALAVASAAGFVLLVADLLPFWRERVTAGPRLAALGDMDAPLARLVDEIAGQVGVPPPRIVLLDDAAPHLFCAGLVRPAIVVSQGTLAVLEPARLRAALAHELAHLRSRDLHAGWLLMGVRAVMWFNPIVQLSGRQIVQELEWRADDLAAAATGDRAALAAGLRALSGTALDAQPDLGGWRRGWRRWLQRALAHGRSAALTARCARLLAPPPIAEPLVRARLAMTAIALAGLLFFVV